MGYEDDDVDEKDIALLLPGKGDSEKAGKSINQFL